MINEVILVGRLGEEPKSAMTASSKPVAKLRIATGGKYKGKDGKEQDSTEWHNVVLWDSLATVAEKFLHKGSMVYVRGRIQTRGYEKDGQKHWATEIIAKEMQMLDKREEGKSEAKHKASTDDHNFPALNDINIPF